MTGTFTRHEWIRMLDQKLLYVWAILFLLASGLFTWIFNGGLLAGGSASLRDFFNVAYHGLFLLLPLPAFRMINRERENGSLEWLLTRPVGIFQIVLGKYLALLLFLIVLLVLTLPYGITLALAGNPDRGAILGGYLGLFLTGAVFAALAMMAGGFLRKQVWALILAYGLSLLFHGILASFLPPEISPFFSAVGLQSGFQLMSLGVLELQDLFYMLSVIFAAIYIILLSIRELR